MSQTAPTPPVPAPGEQFAADFATLAREIAQDIFTVDQIVALHRLTDQEWTRIQAHPRFQRMLVEMQRDWASAANTRERVRLKAQTGLETQLEVLISEISDTANPLTQRVEAAKFLARLGEMDQPASVAPGIGSGISIHIHTSRGDKGVTIEGSLAKQVTDGD